MILWQCFHSHIRLRFFEYFHSNQLQYHKLRSVHSGTNKVTCEDKYLFWKWNIFSIEITHRDTEVTKWFHDWEKKSHKSFQRKFMFRVSQLKNKEHYALLFLLILLRVLHTEQVMGWSMNWEQTSAGNNTYSQASIILISKMILTWSQKLNYAYHITQSHKFK